MTRSSRAESSPNHPVDRYRRWMDGAVDTPAGKVIRVRTSLSLADRVGSAMARWGMGRMHYSIRPGLYAVGNPDSDSPVLVSANYKMSFDRLRATLAGRHAWLLILDTRGINVWCAAGKGTFGADEIAERVKSSGLDRIVTHRRLIVPQLGAPGVSAHGVLDGCGFRVTYGPVRACDIPAFLDNGLTATAEMRRVRFGFRDRLVLIPIEVVMSMRTALLLSASAFLLGGLGAGGYSQEGLLGNGLPAAASIIASFITGSVLGPVLLPFLPGRAFSLKGAVLGACLAIALILSGGLLESGRWLDAVSLALAIPAITSFIVMGFTGATTFTSQSGVLREMRIALPLQAGTGALGLALWLTGLFVQEGR